MKTEERHRQIRLFRGRRYVLREEFKTGRGVKIPEGTEVFFKGPHRDQIGVVPGSVCCTARIINPKPEWPEDIHPKREILGPINGC